MSLPIPYARVLVLGMDGLDPRRVAAMVQEGRLPAFAGLQETGTLCPLATSNPAESPVAWSSLATGCNPGKHGIFDFIHRHPKGYVPFLSLLSGPNQSESGKAGNRFVCPRSAPGFWRLASDAGLPTTVVRWPVTFPAEEVSGNFLAGLGVPDVTGRLGKYTYFTTDRTVQRDEKVIHVSWRGDRMTTHLPGPQMRGLAGVRPVTAKLILERTGSGVVLSLGSERQNLEPGQWSKWFPIKFKWGPVCLSDAIVKFRLVTVSPELRLYATASQIHPEHQAWPLTSPASYGAQLAGQIGPFYTLGLPEDTHAVTDGRYDLDAFLQQCSEIGHERRAMFEHELHRFDEGVLAFVFDAGDRLQHMFWSVDDRQSPTFDPARAEKYGHVIPDLYREMDGLLATALDAVDDDTAVFVVSDHGFGPFRRAVHLNRWLVDNGFMKLHSNGEGRSLFADVDWSATQAYAIGFTSVYLNLAGRESHGIVKSGDEAESLQARIVDALRATRDPEDGANVIRNAYTARNIYTGTAAAKAPDLVVGFEPGYRASWQTALGGAPMDVVVDNDKLWAADHLVDPSAVPGVLASNAPITPTQPAGTDLAPTILTCLGLPIPSEMDGRSWLDDQPADSVTTEDASTAEPTLVGAPTSPVDADGLDDTQRAQLEKHLSDLGYL